MINYKFYTTEALIKNREHLFDNENDKVVMTTYSHCTVNTPLCRDLKLNKRSEIFECNYKKWLNEDILYSSLDFEECLTLAAAVAYDSTVHPDETVYVTANPQAVPIANKFFGEDSIILLED